MLLSLSFLWMAGGRKNYEQSIKRCLFHLWLPFLFFSFHIAAFAHIVHHSPNLLEVVIRGMVGKGEEEENTLMIKAEN